jgi:PilZ domain
MNEEISGKPRRYQRISLPKGMDVVWYGAGQQQVSRVRTLGMGGAFICASISPPVGTDLKLIFQVPGGVVAAEGVVRNIVTGEGMGVEFTKLGPTDRVLLEQLLERLLR